MTPEMQVLREKEAAQRMGVSVAALRRWRLEGRGPQFVKMERCVGYLLADIQSYLLGSAQFSPPDVQRHTKRIPNQKAIDSQSAAK